MRLWFFRKAVRTENASGLYVAGQEFTDADAGVLLMQPAHREGAADLADPTFMFAETPLHMQLDEGGGVSVSLGDQNAAAMLETTQRIRETRERERSSVPPVYNFGGEARWSGGDW